MEKDLEKYFIKTYPKIFRDMYGDPKETCLSYGIECGSGWFFLLDKLCFNIQHRIDFLDMRIKKGLTLPDEVPIPQVVAAQIKEKFGGLRFYYEGGDSAIRFMVDFAEDLSTSICENCGKFNEDVGWVQTGWIQHLCTNCSVEYGKEIAQQDDLVALWTRVMRSRKNPTRSWKSVDELAVEDFQLPKKKKK